MDIEALQNRVKAKSGPWPLSGFSLDSVKHMMSSLCRYSKNFTCNKNSVKSHLSEKKRSIVLSYDVINENYLSFGVNGKQLRR